MSKLIQFIVLVYSIISIVSAGYLDGLGRSFDDTNGKVVEIRLYLTEEELTDLYNKTQVSYDSVQNHGSKYLPDFESNTATMKINYDNFEKTYTNINFKTGGMYARSNDKVGFNFKLSKKFLGRKNLRLRPEVFDPAHVRSKIACDIFNRAGLPSVQSTFAEFYVNDKYFGLYTLMDSIKPKWIEYVYGIDHTKNLYQCKNNGEHLMIGDGQKCENEDDNLANNTEPLEDLIVKINSATTIEEVEKYLDVDNFLTGIALEWLIGSFDHFLILGHNFYLYQRESDGKFEIIHYDFDTTFGIGAGTFWWDMHGIHYENLEVYDMTIKQYDIGIPILTTLIHNDDTRFKAIVRKILVNAFNPVLLEQHFNDIQGYLYNYVVKDYTPNEEGKYPGRINEIGQKTIPYIEWFKENLFYTKENDVIGLLDWITKRFNSACEIYGFDKDEINAEALASKPDTFFNTYIKDTIPTPTTSINTIQTTIMDTIMTNIPTEIPTSSSFTSIPTTTEMPIQSTFVDTSVPTQEIPIPSIDIDSPISAEIPTDIRSNDQYINNEANLKPRQYDDENKEVETIYITSTIYEEELETIYATDFDVETITITNTEITTGSEDSDDDDDEDEDDDENDDDDDDDENDDECWSSKFGYDCCDNCNVILADNDGNWGVMNGNWCGIKDDMCRNGSTGCPNTGYPCCENCNVVLTDDTGRWGIENSDWCSIPFSCKKMVENSSSFF